MTSDNRCHVKDIEVGDLCRPTTGLWMTPNSMLSTSPFLSSATVFTVLEKKIEDNRNSVPWDTTYVLLNILTVEGVKGWIKLEPVHLLHRLSSQ